MATLICTWDAPGSKLATWPTATFALYTDTHCVTAFHSYTALYSAIQRYTLYSYTAIQRYTLYKVYNTPLGGRWGSVVFGWRALRSPRVVFVLGCVSLMSVEQ